METLEPCCRRVSDIHAGSGTRYHLQLDRHGSPILSPTRPESQNMAETRTSRPAVGATLARNRCLLTITMDLRQSGQAGSSTDIRTAATASKEERLLQQVTGAVLDITGPDLMTCTFTYEARHIYHLIQVFRALLHPNLPSVFVRSVSWSTLSTNNENREGQDDIGIVRAPSEVGQPSRLTGLGFSLLAYIIKRSRFQLIPTDERRLTAKTSYPTLPSHRCLPKLVHFSLTTRTPSFQPPPFRSSSLDSPGLPLAYSVPRYRSRRQHYGTPE